MPACKQDVKFLYSTTENNEIVLNDDYKDYSYGNIAIQRNCWSDFDCGGPKNEICISTEKSYEGKFVFNDAGYDSSL